MMTKILLVDDHKVIRDGVRNYLDDEPMKYKVVGEAGDGNEALQELEQKQVDLILMDINMDGMNGIELASEVHDKYPEVAMVALSMLNEALHIKQMLAHGVKGYILKNAGEQQIKEAIDTVANGDSYYSPEVTRQIMNQLAAPAKSPGTKSLAEVKITKREEEVLHLIVKEYSNQEIADELFISLRTVDAHKRNLLEKTGARNVAGLVKFALSNKVFD